MKANQNEGTFPLTGPALYPQWSYIRVGGRYVLMSRTG